MKTLSWPLLALTLAAPAAAQLEWGGAPRSAGEPLHTLLPTEIMPWVDVAPLRAQNETPSKDTPFQWAAEIPVRLGLETAGAWDFAEDGALVWRLRISSPDAHSIGLEFSEYTLAPGAELFVYSDDRADVYGAFTSRNNKENGQFAIRPVPGDALTLEYVQPAHVSGSSSLTVGLVMHDFVDLYRKIEVGGGGGGITGGCAVNINCPEGDDWQVHKRAVARTLSGGSLCSGGLLNNTAEDGTQYFLQASHCGSLNNGVFLFDYENSGCSGGSASSNKTVQGSTLIHSASANDFRLVRITEQIPSNYEPYFAGWNRSTNAWTGGASINHPGGGTKEIQIENNAVGKESQVWRCHFDAGLVLGGSSGGPVYDNNGRVRGSAWYVNSFSCGSQSVWYGRFDKSWGSISGALDPVGSGATFIDGFDSLAPPPPPPPPPPPEGLSVTDIQPTMMTSVEIDGQEVVITGSGFDEVIAVRVNGVELNSGFPSDWVKDSEVQITIKNWPKLDTIGPVTVEVDDGTDQESGTVVVMFPNPPVLDVLNSVPSFLFSVVPVTAWVGARPSAIVFLTVSPDNTPTDLPGIVSLDIGAGFTSLIGVGSGVAGDGAWTQIDVPLGSPPPGLTVYWQAAVYDPIFVFGGFPLMTTNVQETMILF